MTSRTADHQRVVTDSELIDNKRASLGTDHFANTIYPPVQRFRSTSRIHQLGYAHEPILPRRITVSAGSPESPQMETSHPFFVLGFAMTTAKRPHPLSFLGRSLSPHGPRSTQAVCCPYSDY